MNKEVSKLILGVDPGSIKTGYALVSSEGKKISVLKSGVIFLGSEKSFFNRLVKLKLEIEELIEGLENFELAIESLIHVKNINSLAKLSQARGVILSVVGELTNRIYEYSPNLVKSSVSGHGHSSKQSIEKALRFIFPEKKFETDDESDALAIAVCHSLYRGRSGIQNFKTSSKKGGSLKQALSYLKK